MTLLSLKPRYRLEPKILKAFKDKVWGTFLSVDDLECYRTASAHVPEHRQFTDMMHDVYAYIQRCEQIEDAGIPAAASDPLEEMLGLSSSLGQLNLTHD
ncbi:hypothetical protein Ptr902_06989 [Pyrenophora tritici-repentis]|nr:hypothetical protein Ptr902_06989 [Pyrenophora tritici-repentis]